MRFPPAFMSFLYQIDTGVRGTVLYVGYFTYFGVLGYKLTSCFFCGHARLGGYRDLSSQTGIPHEPLLCQNSMKIDQQKEARRRKARRRKYKLGMLNPMRDNDEGELSS